MIPPWLLLAHQLPTRSSNARVKTWRRLQQIGAVAARNSVYVLPNTDHCREDFEWLRSEILSLGGEASVFEAALTDEAEGAALIEQFRRLRADEYRALKRDAERLLTSTRGKRPARVARDAGRRRAVRTLRERFEAVARIDFFQATGREDAAAVLARFDRIAEASTVARRPDGVARLAAGEFTNRRWVTRPGPGVDRMASAWLIRRFIDPKATFAFVEQPEGADVPFDMYGGEFTHQGSMCTFETMAQRFGLDDPAVTRLGQIVHDLDIKDARFARSESPAIGHVIEGLRRLHADDHALLEQGIAVFEALASSFGSPGRPVRVMKARRPTRNKRVST
jgi:hypothetical protein